MADMLFPIELEGAGTCDVESLASYVYRVAYEHGIFVGELLRHINKQTSALTHLDSDTQPVPAFLKPAEMVRNNRSSAAIQGALEKLTGLELSQSRLLFMTSDIGRSPNEVSPGFRWCPECMGEWQALGQQPFFKLIWHLSAITHCPSHRTELISQCAFCSCKQTGYIRKRGIGLCQQCGRHLGTRNPDKPGPEIARSWEMKGADVHQFFVDMAQQPLTDELEGGIWRSLRDLFDHYWGNGKELELYQAFPRDEWISLYHKQKPVSFSTARRLCYGLGIDLYTLISGNAIHSTQVLSQKWLCELPAGFCERKSRQKRNHDAIQSKLRRYLDPCVSPKPMKEVAAELNVSVGYLEYRYPTAVSALVKRHQSMIAAQRQRAREKALNSALQYFTDSSYSGYPKSRKQAYLCLREETGLPKFLLKGAIGEVYSALYT
ncbi:TniQ family protein [Alcanivorax sp.]|uniref:TniQ family protein n=1 Tax=Alcanivorax sp. TaxID=1872427 RepID=UPI0026098CE9|nr:TniQ family protein [Alcanivorax sp.]